MAGKGEDPNCKLADGTPPAMRLTNADSDPQALARRALAQSRGRVVRGRLRPFARIREAAGDPSSPVWKQWVALVSAGYAAERDEFNPSDDYYRQNLPLYYDEDGNRTIVEWEAKEIIAAPQNMIDLAETSEGPLTHRERVEAVAWGAVLSMRDRKANQG